MIETKFAMSKFVNAAKKVYGDDVDQIDWIINVENNNLCENFDSIFYLDAERGFPLNRAVDEQIYQVQWDCLVLR